VLRDPLQPFPRHEGQVGTPHRVWIALDLEACILREDQAQSLLFDESAEPDGQTGRDSPVARARGLAHHEVAPDQLEHLARDRGASQLLGGHQLLGGGHVLQRSGSMHEGRALAGAGSPGGS
jgi:hypothetical protein